MTTESKLTSCGDGAHYSVSACGVNPSGGDRKSADVRRPAAELAAADAPLMPCVEARMREVEGSGCVVCIGGGDPCMLLKSCARCVLYSVCVMCVFVMCVCYVDAVPLPPREHVEPPSSARDRSALLTWPPDSCARRAPWTAHARTRLRDTVHRLSRLASTCSAPACTLAARDPRW